MRKLKKGIAVLSLVVGVLAINVYPTFAAVDPTVSDAVGGWDEDTGYFINAEAYSKAMNEDFLLRASSPVHKGKRERSDYDGFTHYRAHGWTTWQGKYHYTRARMEDSDGDVLKDSGRVWGQDNTEAISPYYKYNPDVADKARHYYNKTSFLP